MEVTGKWRKKPQGHKQRDMFQRVMDKSMMLNRTTKCIADVKRAKMIMPIGSKAN